MVTDQVADMHSWQITAMDASNLNLGEGRVVTAAPANPMNETGQFMTVFNASSKKTIPSNFYNPMQTS